MRSRMATRRSVSMKPRAGGPSATSSTETRRQPGSFPAILAIEPDRDRAGMRLQSLRLGEGDRRPAQPAQLIGAELEERGALHEIEHRQPRGEARRARG